MEAGCSLPLCVVSSMVVLVVVLSAAGSVVGGLLRCCCSCWASSGVVVLVVVAAMVRKQSSRVSFLSCAGVVMRVSHWRRSLALAFGTFQASALKISFRTANIFIVIGEHWLLYRN